MKTAMFSPTLSSVCVHQTAQLHTMAISPLHHSPLPSKGIDGGLWRVHSNKVAIRASTSSMIGSGKVSTLRA